MSALPPKADTPSGDREVRFVPTADKMVRRGAMSALLSPKNSSARELYERKREVYERISAAVTPVV
jgi:hypothetical protein